LNVVAVGVGLAVLVHAGRLAIVADCAGDHDGAVNTVVARCHKNLHRPSGRHAFPESSGGGKQHTSEHDNTKSSPHSTHLDLPVMLGRCLRRWVATRLSIFRAACSFWKWPR